MGPERGSVNLKGDGLNKFKKYERRRVKAKLGIEVMEKQL